MAILVLLAAFPLAQASALALFPEAAKMLSYAMLIAAPAIAGACCLFRARRSAATLAWAALGVGALVWAAGIGAAMAGELLAGFDDNGAFSLLLFILYGVPIIFVAASPAHETWRVRLIDAALALALGVLFFLHTFTFASAGGTDDEGFLKLRLMFDIENVFIALFAMVRWRTAREPAEQTFFRALTLYSVLYLAVAAYINHLQADAEYGGPADVLIPLPFLLLAGLALLARDRAGTHVGGRASDAFVRVATAGSPIMLSTAVLTVSASLVIDRPAFGIVGFAVALFGYGTRSILVQVRGHDERAALATLALTDALTGLANRRRFDEALDSEWSRARRSGGQLALLMIDIDRFKQFNDALGHPAGDRCLHEVGRTLARCVRRKSDVVARYGGEEFAVILPDTSKDDALRVAEWMRKKVAGKGLRTPARGGVVTVSIGVGWARQAEGDDPTLLTSAADGALYEAKLAGRNRVAVGAADIPPLIGRLSSSA
jgi:diguanylate cyclase (GGDEF)-like protein